MSYLNITWNGRVKEAIQLGRIETILNINTTIQQPVAFRVGSPPRKSNTLVIIPPLILTQAIIHAVISCYALLLSLTSTNRTNVQVLGWGSRVELSAAVAAVMLHSSPLFETYRKRRDFLSNGPKQVFFGSDWV